MKDNIQLVINNTNDLSLDEHRGIYYKIVNVESYWKIDKNNYLEVEEAINKNDFKTLDKIGFYITSDLYDFKLNFKNQKYFMFRYILNKEKQRIEPVVLDGDLFDNLEEAQEYLKQQLQEYVDDIKKGMHY